MKQSIPSAHRKTARYPEQTRVCAQTLFEQVDAAPDDWALFVDIDGTLIDIAATPQAIVVPPDLPGTLVKVHERMHGAIALVTGRNVDWVRRMFQPFTPHAAGLHGAERLMPDGTVTTVRPPSDSDLLRRTMRQHRLSGVEFEDKGAAFALHYRGAPQQQAHVEDFIQQLFARLQPGWRVQRGKCVLEIHPDGVSKGETLQAFMAQQPFAGRRPLAIGDDLTDEKMFAAAQALGGLAIRIDQEPRETLADALLHSPAQLRARLRGLAR